MDNKELKQVKTEVKERLEALGYEDIVSENIEKIIEYYNGKPAKAQLKNGWIMYL